MFLFALLLAAHAANPAGFAGQSQMNGIAFTDHLDFAKKWDLVTIRYRKDTGEMRLTYGNESAIKVLQAGSTDYPDGAVFAKTGVHTGVDPQFVSSVVPKGIRRYQFMVRDRKKYSSTGGWGYALFDADGKTFPEDPAATQDACYACHALVENRGDVFSQPFSFTSKTHFPVQTGRTFSGPAFTDVVPARLPPQVRQHLPKGAKRVRMVSSAKLRAHVFQGTLDEMKPQLELEAGRTGVPALFLSKDRRRFTLVLPNKLAECGGLIGFTVVSTDLHNQAIEEKRCGHD